MEAIDACISRGISLHSTFLQIISVITTKIYIFPYTLQHNQWKDKLFNVEVSTTSITTALNHQGITQQTREVHTIQFIDSDRQPGKKSFWDYIIFTQSVQMKWSGSYLYVWSDSCVTIICINTHGLNIHSCSFNYVG